MPKYTVEVAYKTKRNSVSCAMTIEAENEDVAIEIGEMRIFRGYPARKHAYTRVTEQSS
jgi:hypothetical protein